MTERPHRYKPFDIIEGRDKSLFRTYLILREDGHSKADGCPLYAAIHWPVSLGEHVMCIREPPDATLRNEKR